MTNHPLEQEELMAYLDGELPASQAAAASEHLESCAECRDLAADLQSVSRRLMAWQVERSEPANMKAIEAALEERGKKPQALAAGWRSWFGNPVGRRLVMSGGLAVVSAIVLAAIFMPNLMRSRRAAEDAEFKAQSQTVTVDFGPEYGKSYGAIAPAKPAPSTPSGRRSSGGKDKGNTEAQYSYDSVNRIASSVNSAKKEAQDGNQPHGYDGLGRTIPADDALANERVTLAIEGATKPALSPRSQMIIHTAQLALTTREFDKTRAQVEVILKNHHGYAGELNVNTPAGAARSLNGTLRVPATELDAMLNDLKHLGRVEHESQGGEEVTAHYVDLEARLANARNTERRLTDMLRERTGKLADVLAVEESISTTRGEIEQMEAERKNMANQVDYATIQVTITEEYKASLQVVPVTTWTRISNAAVEGYHSLAEGLISLVLFFVSAGPSLLFWGLLLFFPVRMVWRKIRLRTEIA